MTYGRGTGLHDSLGHVASLAFLDELDKSVVFESAQVVVHLLACQPDPGRQRGCRSRHRQFGQNPLPNRIERRLGSSGAIDDCYVQHEKTIPPTTKSVKTEKIVGGMVSEIRYRLRSGGLFRSRAEYVSHDEIWPVWYPVMNHA